jgi:hypothetical protein
MNNTNFAEILDGLEKDVFDLVSNLERQIGGRMASYGSGSRIPAKNEPVKPFQPKWRGLRGALRWLWKGHSRDNPDYAHLYDKEVKSESKNGRPTLAEYLVDVRLIDGFAEEICSEVLSDFLNESSMDISDLLRQFKLDFRNIILKYKNLIKSAGPTAPEVAPAATGSKPVTPSAPVQASKPTEPKAPETQNSEPASSQKDSEEEGVKTGEQEKKPEEKDASSEEEKKENIPPAAQEDGEENGDSGSGSNKAGANRKPKSYSANMGTWFKEAMEAKNRGGDSLTPNPEWLNSKGRTKGIVKPEKLPWVIAWMGTKSHKDLHKDEDVRSELQSAIGSSFKDFVPKVGKDKDGNDSLVRYIRMNMPTISDEEFKRLVSELYGSKYDGPGASFQKKNREKKEDSNGKKIEEPTIQEKEIEVLSSLYAGASPIDASVAKLEDDFSKENDRLKRDAIQDQIKSLKKENILDKIESKIIKPTFYLILREMEKKDEAKNFASWWKKFKEERMEDKEEDAESMIARINNGAMLKLVVKKSKVEIDEDTLLNMLKT